MHAQAFERPQTTPDNFRQNPAVGRAKAQVPSGYWSIKLPFGCTRPRRGWKRKWGSFPRSPAEISNEQLLELVHAWLRQEPNRLVRGRWEDITVQILHRSDLIVHTGWTMSPWDVRYDFFAELLLFSPKPFRIQYTEFICTPPVRDAIVTP